MVRRSINICNREGVLREHGGEGGGEAVGVGGGAGVKVQSIWIPGGKDAATRTNGIAGDERRRHARWKEGGSFEEIAITEFSLLKTNDRGVRSSDSVTNDCAFFRVA
jgi:hypothetical protein